MKQWIGSILVWGFAIVCALVAIVPRILYPELTETQLFIRVWWLWGPLIIIGGGILLGSYNKGRY